MAVIWEAALKAWEERGDEASMIALCEALSKAMGSSAPPRPELLRKIGNEARLLYPDHVDVQLGVASVYILADHLAAAQSLLVRLAGIASKEPRVIELLGETLLRLGDAKSAAKALNQAIGMGALDAHTASMRDRAEELVAVQESSGEPVVAERAKRALTSPPPLHLSAGHGRARNPKPLISETSYSIIATHGEERTGVRSQRPSREPGPRGRSEPRNHRSSGRPSARAAAPERPSAAEPEGTRLASQPPVAPSIAPPAAPPPTTIESVATNTIESPAEPSVPAIPASSSLPAPAADEATSANEEHMTAAPSVKPPESDETIDAGDSRAFDPPAAPTARRFRLVAAAAVVSIGAAAVFGGARIAARARLDAAVEQQDALLQEAEAALEMDDPEGIAAADAALAHIDPSSGSSREIATALLHVRVVAALEQGESIARLDAAITQAQSFGDSADITFATLAKAVALKSGSRVEALLSSGPLVVDESPFSKAVAELVIGAALELRADPKAVAHYAASLEAEPRFCPAEVRLMRARLLFGAPDEVPASPRAKSACTGAVVAAFAALAGRSERSRGEELRLVAEAERGRAKLPRSLAPMVDALDGSMRADPVGQAAALAAAIEAADSPAAVTFVGEVALESGALASTELAARTALEMAPTFPAARVLEGRVALARGDLDGVGLAASKLDARSSAGLRAVLAYESSDLKAASAALSEITDPRTKRLAGDALDRLRGMSVDHNRLVELGRDGDAWAELIAADAALDSGDATTAAEIMKSWDGKNPLHAARIARRLRYADKVPEAREALEGSFASDRALLEQVLLARPAKDMKRVLARVAASSGPDRDWLLILGIARQREFDQAFRAILHLEMPNRDAPFCVRLAAALALAELHDGDRAATLLRPILEALPNHQDASRAAMDLGILPSRAR